MSKTTDQNTNDHEKHIGNPFNAVPVLTYPFNPKSRYIKTIFPSATVEFKIHQLPFLKSLNKRLPATSHRRFFRILIHFILATDMFLFTYYSHYATVVDGKRAVLALDCYSSLYRQCGVMGELCPEYSFRLVAKCPAGCSTAKATGPVHLGNKKIQRIPLVVGGIDNTFRGDTWICTAAMHASLISEQTGGGIIIDAIFDKSFSQDRFASTQMKGGFTTSSFDSHFPYAIRLSKPDTCFGCLDWAIYSLPVFVLGLLALPFFGVSKHHLFIAALFWGSMYWVFLGTDIEKGDHSIAVFLGRLIPIASFLFVIYQTFVKNVLPSPTKFPIDIGLFFTTPLWLGFYFETLMSYISNAGIISFNATMFETWEMIVLTIIISTILLISLLYFLKIHRQAGILFSHFRWYILILTIWISLTYIFKFYFHIHHFMFGLLAISVTRLQTRYSLVIQSFAVGMMVQGVLKWGFSTLFETRADYLGGNGLLLGSHTPTWDNGTFGGGVVGWKVGGVGDLNLTVGDLGVSSLVKVLGGGDAKEFPYASYSVVMNDILVYRGKLNRFNYSEQTLFPIVENVPYYFRVALIEKFGRAPLDYSDILTMYSNGSFSTNKF